MLLSFWSSGLNYAGCLEDSSSGAGGRTELVIFSSSTPGNFTLEQCNSVCFAKSQRYGGLGARQECLCSTNSEPNLLSEAQCTAACTNPQVMKVCMTNAEQCQIIVIVCRARPPPHVLLPSSFVSLCVNTSFRISSKPSYSLIKLPPMASVPVLHL